MEYQKHTYENGLRLITVPMKSTKAVTVLTLVGTGSKYETKDINGISHFLEHMMFKGTKKRPTALDISKTLDGMGAEYNAFTSFEMTGYYAKASRDKLDLVMDVISDIFLNGKLNQEEIDREKHVVIEEINMYQDNPARDVFDKWYELLYGDQPAGWKIAGEKETLLGMKREQFVDYFNTHYFASNTLVVVAGDVEHEDIKTMTAKYFAGSREHEDLTKLPVKEAQTEPKLTVHYKKTDQTNFLLGVRAYPLGHPKEDILALMSSILGAGMSSRLFIEVRERRGLAYTIKATVDTLSDHGYLATYGGVNNEKAISALEVVLNEYEKLKTELVPEDELKKAKDQLRGRMVIGLEQSDDMAVWYGEQELLEGKILTPEEKLEKINSVTAEEIKEVANEIFTNDRLNLALIGPFEDGKPFKEILNIK